MSEPGAQDPIARWFRNVLTAGADQDHASGDMIQPVMARLPQASPIFYHDVASLVIEAWGDPMLREALRTKTDLTLAARGFVLPPGTDVQIVPLNEATLPTAHHLFLPIAAPVGETAPHTADEAAARLMDTDWRWVLAAPGATTASVTRERAASAWAASSSSPATRRAPLLAWRSWLTRPAFVWAGAAAMLLLAWTALSDGSLAWDLGGALSATASGAPPWALIAAAVVAVAALIWWNTRHGA